VLRWPTEGTEREELQIAPSKEAPSPEWPENPKGFVIMARGLFPRGNITVEYRPGRLSWETPAEDVIEREWKTYFRDAQKAGMRVYNGNLFRLDGLDTQGGGLHLALSDTDFRSSIGTAGGEFRALFPNLPQANPLTVCATLVTEDGKILLEKRSRLDSRRHPYHVIAGYMERGSDGTENPHPVDTLAREIREELGVEMDKDNVRATGLVRTIYGSELCFCSSLDYTFDDLLKIQAGPGTDAEIEMLHSVEDTPSALAGFLAHHGTDLVPSGQACLLFYGREKYGNEWYNGGVPREQ
jgi:hypothetical protein